jgi:AraC family transcriptional activator of pobA
MRPPPKPRTARAVPRFALYGEAASPGQELLHIEDVQSRSRSYHWEIQPHEHQGLHQILWIYRGAAEVSLDETSQTIEGPAAILVPPGVVHGFRFRPETDGLVLTLSARFAMEGEPGSAGEAFGALFAEPGALRFSGLDPVVARLDALLRELAAEFVSPDAAQSPVTLWLARAVLWRLARARAALGPAQGVRERRDRTLHQRFLRLVEEHFLERWPLSRYADRLGLSTQRLNRLARAESGRSALEIVHERMTREACRRLYYVAAPAEKLGMELGFEDPAYFSRFFKRRTGMSPRQWRENHRAGY